MKSCERGSDIPPPGCVTKTTLCVLYTNKHCCCNISACPSLIITYYVGNWNPTVPCDRKHGSGLFQILSQVGLISPPPHPLDSFVLTISKYHVFTQSLALVHLSMRLDLGQPTPLHIHTNTASTVSGTALICAFSTANCSLCPTCCSINRAGGSSRNDSVGSMAAGDSEYIQCTIPFLQKPFLIKVCSFTSKIHPEYTGRYGDIYDVL